MTGAAGFVTWRRVIEWVAIVIGFVAVRFVGRPTNWLGWLMLMLAGVLIAAPVVLAAQWEYLREHEAAAANNLATVYRDRLGVTLGDAIIPLADLIRRINSNRGDERSQLRAQLEQGTVDAAAGLCGGDRTRAAFFTVADDALRPVAWSGRSEPPPPVFSGGSRRIRDLVRHHHGRLLIRDTAGEDAPLHINPIGEYGSLILVVITTDGGDGLLVVDAHRCGDLADNDLDLVATLGHLLSAGLTTGPPRRRPTTQAATTAQ
jgi:hypothetical protein